jgi:hypothetical protein
MSSPPKVRPGKGAPHLYVVLRSGARDSAIAAATRCLKRLVPDASVLVAPAFPPPDAEVVTLDAEEVAAGPLSAASALDRERGMAPRDPRRG